MSHGWIIDDVLLNDYLLSSDQSTSTKGSALAVIASYVRPQELYRYRSLREFDREIKAIEEGYVFCAPFSTLNDPMEGLFSSSRHLRESEDYRAVKESILDNKSQIGMCSFSEVHNHELMWAHYADQFRGICIAYRFAKLLEHLPEQLSFVRMFYNETAPTLHRTSTDIEHEARMILSYKNYRWLYEREWRMFAPLGKARYKRTACVTRIYLGSRITDLDRQMIIDRLAPLKIKTHSMTIRKYSISFDPDPHAWSSASR